MNSFYSQQKLFQTVASRLRDRIDAGEWPLDGRLPTEAELSKAYSVGINTVRRAVEVLVEEGVVRRRQGSGTYVAVERQGNGSHFVGVVVPSTSYYFPSVIAGIERVTGAAGARLLLASSDYDPALELTRVRELIESGASGLLIAPTLHRGDPTDQFEAIRSLPIPAMLLERRPPSPTPDDTLSYVCTDVVGGGYAAVRHLMDQGRRRIGFLGRSDTATAEQVFEGYDRAISDLGLEQLPSAVVRAAQWPAAALQSYADTARSERLDAIFCLGDREATALLPRLRSAGISVPSDVAVVAYDDEVADLAEVPLSAVSPPKFEVGRLAALTLLRQIALDGSRHATRTLLQPCVTVRASSVLEPSAEPVERPA
ncbi:hypothetical protein GCM10028784_25960 [Myceligenerans cantabricum]